MKLKFRARLTKDGKPWMFYQDDQYLISFLRRCTNFIAFDKDGDGQHESYLPKSLEDYLDVFTGQYDKNKKEIYEKDVIGEPKVGEEAEFVGAVKYDTDLASCIIEKSNGGWEYLHQHFVEHNNHKVIGNTFENPELLTASAREERE